MVDDCCVGLSMIGGLVVGVLVCLDLRFLLFCCVGVCCDG